MVLDLVNEEPSAYSFEPNEYRMFCRWPYQLQVSLCFIVGKPNAINYGSLISNTWGSREHKYKYWICNIIVIYYLICSGNMVKSSTDVIVFYLSSSPCSIRNGICVWIIQHEAIRPQHSAIWTQSGTKLLLCNLLCWAECMVEDGVQIVVLCPCLGIARINGKYISL